MQSGQQLQSNVWKAQQPGFQNSSMLGVAGSRPESASSVQQQQQACTSLPQATWHMSLAAEPDRRTPCDTSVNFLKSSCSHP